MTAQTLQPGAIKYFTIGGAVLQLNDDGTVQIEGTTVTVNGLPVATITFSGVWSAVTAYVVGNVVSYLGDLYISIQAGTNKIPASQPTFWALILDAPAIGTTVVGPGVFGGAPVVGVDPDYASKTHWHGLPALEDLTITTSAAIATGLRVRAFAGGGQSADIFEILAANGTTVLARFDSAGNVYGPNIVSDELQIGLITAASVLTLNDENPTVFTGSRRLVAGSGITFDTSVADVLTVSAGAGGAAFVAVVQAASLNYTKDGARHPSSLAFTPVANKTYRVRIFGWWSGMANGGEQYTMSLTLPAGATFQGRAVLQTVANSSDANFTGGGVGQVTGAANSNSAMIDGVLVNAAAATLMSFDVGDNSGGGSGLFRAGSTLEYCLVN